jgi:hypothetical protein
LSSAFRDGFPSEAHGFDVDVVPMNEMTAADFATWLATGA